MKIIAKTCRKNQQRKFSTRKDVDREIKDAFKRNSYKMQQSTKKRDVKRKAKILEESKGSEPCTSKKPTRIRKISQCEVLVRKLSESSSNRRRKTADEIQLLERCFIQDEEWKRETVEYIKTNSQLTYTQIYKWGWDQKKKLDENQGSFKIPTIDEFGGYCKFQKQSNVSNKFCNEKSNDLTSFPSLKWKLENKDSQIFKESHENKLMVQ